MSTAGPKHITFGVISESDSDPIIKSQFRSFLWLSLLFLFPFSFSLFNFIQPTFEVTFSEINANHIQSLIVATTHSFHQIKTLSLPLTYSLFLLILFISVVATISYTTHHGFYRTPVKLISSSIKFLFYIFTPLAATSLVSQVIVTLFALASVLFVGLMSRCIELLIVVLFHENNYIDHKYYSDYFTGLVCGVFLMILFGVVLYVQVNWSLASVIFVVVESSKWGLEPVRRSKDLVREMRGVFLILIYVYGSIIYIGHFVVGYIGYNGVMNQNNMDGFSYGWKSWVFMVQTMVGPIFIPMFMRFYMSAFAVLYVFCKVMRGELAWDIAEESVSLPFEDEKDSHVVDVAQT